MRCSLLERRLVDTVTAGAVKGCACGCGTIGAAAA
jgi:hypothetical protein